jgi:putative endonuclease
VKTRRGERYGSPFEAVTPHKQRQIGRVALAYLGRYKQGEVAVRFDVVAVFLDQSPTRIELIKNAFEYNG